MPGGSSPRREDARWRARSGPLLWAPGACIRGLRREILGTETTMKAKTRPSPWPALPALASATALAGLLLAAPANAAEKTILILHKGGESLGFYDAATGKSRAVVPVGTVPHEMVLSADRRLAYVTNYGVGSYTTSEEGGRTVSIVDLARRAKVGEIGLA